MKNPVFNLKALFLFTVVAMTLLSQNSAIAEVTRPFEFITDLVQDIGSITEIRDRAGANIEKNQGDLLNTATDCIRNSTSLQLELGSQIEQFKNVHLASQFIELPLYIVSFWQQRLQIETNDRALQNSFE